MNAKTLFIFIKNYLLIPEITPIFAYPAATPIETQNLLLLASLPLSCLHNPHTFNALY